MARIASEAAPATMCACIGRLGPLGIDELEARSRYCKCVTCAGMLDFGPPSVPCELGASRPIVNPSCYCFVHAYKLVRFPSLLK
jgi:hypothetical protein